MPESDEATQYIGSTITANFRVTVSYRLKPGLTATQAADFIKGKLDEAIVSIQGTLVHLSCEPPEPRIEREAK